MILARGLSVLRPLAVLRPPSVPRHPSIWRQPSVPRGKHLIVMFAYSYILFDPFVVAVHTGQMHAPVHVTVVCILLKDLLLINQVINPPFQLHSNILGIKHGILTLDGTNNMLGFTFAHHERRYFAIIA